ncbi:potassium-transporting ATPase subunit F [Halomonas cupida]
MQLLLLIVSLATGAYLFSALLWPERY